MGTRHNLKHSMIRILQQNHNGSFQTQYDRKKRLLLIVDQLVNGGYQLNSITQLKPKHVEFLVNHKRVATDRKRFSNVPVEKSRHLMLRQPSSCRTLLRLVEAA